MPNAMLGMALPRVRECWAEATNVTSHTIVKWDEVPRHPSKTCWCKVVQSGADTDGFMWVELTGHTWPSLVLRLHVSVECPYS